MTAPIYPPEPGGTPTLRDNPPALALRTYLAMRIGVVAVIALLAFSLWKEYDAAGDCLQGSISAYYYTSVQSVFVGALVALGLVLIVLWGKTPIEDGVLNLAGLLAPVVAFVPTARTNKCGLTNAAGREVRTEGQKANVIEASHDAIYNNMLAYLVVITVVLVLLLVVGILAHTVADWPLVTGNPLAYWIPWAGALVLWALGGYTFWKDRDWFHENAHGWSATVMFVFIVAAVIDIGFQKWRGPTYVGETRGRPWALTYWGLAGLMTVGAAAIYFLGDEISDDFAGHRTFWLEAWMISLLAVFWILQTCDRWREGAPRTAGEKEQMKDRMKEVTA